MQQEQQDHEGDDDALLDQGVLQGRDGAVDQGRAVVGRHDLDARGQAGAQGLETGFDPLDDVEDVGVVAGDDDRADDLALAVELGEAAAELGAEADGADIGDADRSAAGAGLDDEVGEVGLAAEVAAAADEGLAAAELEHAAADLGIAAADDIADIGDGEAEGAQAVGVELDLVLLLEAADAGDLCDAGHALEGVAEAEVLDRAQLGEVVAAAAVDERVLVDPADAGGVGAEGRGDGLGEAGLDPAQVLLDAAAGPVDVDVVGEDDVDEGHAEHRVAAHGLDLRGGQEGAGDRVGDLVLDQGRRAAAPLGEDDHLGLGEVGDRVERDLPGAAHGQQREHAVQQQHHAAVAGAEVDQGADDA